MAVDSSIPARPAIPATAAPIRLPPRHRRRVLLPLPSSSSNVSSPSPPATAGLPPPLARHRGSLCFHHRQWGPSAQRCRHPYSWWSTPPGCTGRRWIIGHLAAAAIFSTSLTPFLASTSSSTPDLPAASSLIIPQHRHQDHNSSPLAVLQSRHGESAKLTFPFLLSNLPFLSSLPKFPTLS